MEYLLAKNLKGVSYKLQILENIDIGKDNPENIDIDKDILQNIAIDKDILQNIDINIDKEIIEN